MQTPNPESPQKTGFFGRVQDGLSPFADANYRWYWLASFCYYTGIFMESIAGLQLAYDLTGQAFLLGVAALSNGVPFALLSLLGGTMADRIPKKGILLWSQFLLASTGLMLCGLLATGLIEYWHLIVFGVVRGMATGFSLPGRLAIVGEVVEEGQFLKAYGLYYMALNAMSIGGPSIAGMIMGLVGGMAGATTAYLVIGLAHLTGLFLLIPVFTRKEPSPKSDTSVWQDLGETFSFAWHSPSIMVLIGAGLGITFFSMSLIPLLPVFADRVFHVPGGVGLAALQAAGGIGGLIGAALITGASQVKRKPLLLLIAGLVQGVTLILFASTNIFSLGVVLMALRGISASCYMTLNSTLFQLNAGPQMRGRAMSPYPTTDSVNQAGSCSLFLVPRPNDPVQSTLHHIRKRLDLNNQLPIWVVGVGPGDPSYVTQRVAELIGAASAVAGFAMPLDTASQWVRGDRVLLDYRNQPERLQELAERAAKGDRCVVCAQGDPTVSAGELIERVQAVWPVVEVVPGISSVQIAATRAGLALEESLVITFHKRGDTVPDAHEFRAVALAGKRHLIVLPRPWDFMPSAMAEFLIDGGVSPFREVTVYEKLTLPDEQATSSTLAELSRREAEFSDLSVFVLPKITEVP